MATHAKLPAKTIISPMKSEPTRDATYQLVIAGELDVPLVIERKGAHKTANVHIFGHLALDGRFAGNDWLCCMGCWCLVIHQNFIKLKAPQISQSASAEGAQSPKI